MLNSENNENLIVSEELFQYFFIYKTDFPCCFGSTCTLVFFSKGRTCKCISDLGADERVFGNKLK
jgi:hypothetical protein